MKPLHPKARVHAQEFGYDAGGSPMIAAVHVRKLPREGGHAWWVTRDYTVDGGIPDDP
jgi:hypothetical protein